MIGPIKIEHAIYGAVLFIVTIIVWAVIERAVNTELDRHQSVI